MSENENNKPVVTYLVDTNVLLDKPTVAYKESVIITPVVLRELEALERKKSDKGLQFQVREAKRAINSEQSKARIIHEENINILSEYIPEGYDKEYADNVILAYATLLTARENLELTILTGDVLLAKKAEALGFKHEMPRVSKGVEHLGVVDFYFDPTKESDSELLDKIQTVANTEPQMLYNPFNLNLNEYLVIWDTSKPTKKYEKQLNGSLEKVPTGGYHPIGVYRFNGLSYQKVERNSLRAKHFGTVKPLNQKQIAGFDLMQNEDIKVKLISGKKGSGKQIAPLFT